MQILALVSLFRAFSSGVPAVAIQTEVVVPEVASILSFKAVAMIDRRSEEHANRMIPRLRVYGEKPSRRSPFPLS
jgi:hypothetical protein